MRRAAEVQRRLLDAALAMLKPGGRLVYAVCSLEPEEGETLAASWLAAGAPARRVAVAEGEVPEGLSRGGYLRTLPCHWAEQGGMDGFFAARFERQ